jgi:hypothetical protein
MALRDSAVDSWAFLKKSKTARAVDDWECVGGGRRGLVGAKAVDCGREVVSSVMISVGERLGVGRRCVWMDFMFFVGHKYDVALHKMYRLTLSKGKLVLPSFIKLFVVSSMNALETVAVPLVLCVVFNSSLMLLMGFLF